MPLVSLSLKDLARLLDALDADPTPSKAKAVLREKLVRVFAPLTEGFETQAEENAYVKKQLAFYEQLGHTGGDYVGWIALKLTVPRNVAAKLVGRATS